MGYDLVIDAATIQTNGDHVDDIDHLTPGTSLEIRYTVHNVGDAPADAHYDFLSISDNQFNVEYEDWAAREAFSDGPVHRSFNVRLPLASGIHWVFVTADAGRDRPPATARVVVVATDEAERMVLLEELRGAPTPPIA
jgi:hypothetical protein